MTQIFRAIAKGQLVPYHFMQSDVAVSQTDVQLTIAEVRDAAATADDQNAVDEYVAPFDGEIIGIGVDFSTAVTAGSFTAGPTINGTEVAALTQTFAGAGQRANATVKRGTAPFLRGAQIGAEITTNGSFAPITADVLVTVYVLLYLGQGAVI